MGGLFSVEDTRFGSGKGVKKLNAKPVVKDSFEVKTMTKDGVSMGFVEIDGTFWWDMRRLQAELQNRENYVTWGMRCLAKRTKGVDYKIVPLMDKEEVFVTPEVARTIAMLEHTVPGNRVGGFFQDVLKVSAQPEMPSSNAIEEAVTVCIDWESDEDGRVDARELWTALGSKQEFSHWFKAKSSNFILHEDFDLIIKSNQTVGSSKNGTTTGSGRGGDRKSQGYWLTLDAAKEVCMMEQTETGRRIRRHFIAIDKEHRRMLSQPRLTREQKLAEALLISQEMLEELRLQKLQLEAKTEAFKSQVTQIFAPHLEMVKLLSKPNSGFLMSGRECAKFLNLGFSDITLYRDYLRPWGWLCKNSTEPTQYAIDRGWLAAAYSVSKTPDKHGEVHGNTTPKFTYHGVLAVLRRMVKDGVKEYSDEVKVREATLLKCLKNGVGLCLSYRDRDERGIDAR